MERKRIRIYTSYKSKKQCSVVFEITYLQHKLLLMEKRKERIDNLEETPHSQRTVLNLQRIMTKPSIFRYEGHNYLVPFLIISSLFFMWGFAHGILEVLNPHFQESFHISKAMSALTQAALVGIFVLSVALVLSRIKLPDPRRAHEADTNEMVEEKPMRVIAFGFGMLTCAILTFVATLIVVVCSGTLSLIAFFALYLGESIMFPTIFSLALRNAGTKTKLASSLLIMTIVGGAIAPVIMGYIADTTGSMAIAFLIPLVCYEVIGGYAAMPRCSSTDVERG